MPKNTHADHLAASPRSSQEVEQIIVMERLHRYNHDLPCGAAALRRFLHEQASVQPLPSLRRIRKVLTLYGLTYGRTGWYDGEELDGLPAAAHVPEVQRKQGSVTDGCHR